MEQDTQYKRYPFLGQVKMEVIMSVVQAVNDGNYDEIRLFP
jgi:hypothetical protein